MTRVRALAADTWELFAELVERNGGCWCTAFHPRPPADRPNREAKHDRVLSGDAHAALVLDDDGHAQAWAQFGRPDELPRIKHRREYEKDAPPVPAWRITCVYVDKRHRGQGLARAAVTGALDLIADEGGGLVEAVSEETAGRQASGRFLFSATAELFDDLGFRRLRKVGMHAWIVTKDVLAS